MSKVVSFGKGARASAGKYGERDFDQKYDPQEFLIPARDHRGFTEKMWLNLQPGDLRRLQVTANSGKFPFKDKSDVARWCLHVGLARLEEMEPVNSHTQQVEAIIALVRETEFLQQFTTLFEDLHRVVQQHHAQGDDGLARRLLSEAWARIQKMPDDGWTEKYRAEFERRFGHFLDGGRDGEGGGDGKRKGKRR